MVQKALSKDPNERFQSADQFRIQLEGVRNSLRAKGGAAAGMGRKAPAEQPEEREEAAAPMETQPVAAMETGNRAEPFPLPQAETVPAFCATQSVGMLQRNLVILGISSLAIGMAVAVLLSMAHL